MGIGSFVRAFLFVLSFTVSVVSHAWIGEISFTEAERQIHLESLPVLLEITSKSMHEDARAQFELYKKCGLMTMYGFKSWFGKATASGEVEQLNHFIKSKAKCEAPPMLADFRVTSCERFTLRHLEAGFLATGQKEIFRRLNKFALLNDRDGLSVAYALTQLGWKAIYWNTDAATKHPSPPDRKIFGATPEDHPYTYSVAKRFGHYYQVPVSAMMINFDPQQGSNTVRDTTVLEKFMKLPYFIGVAHGGFHVFPGTYGVITESHSSHNPDSRKNIEVGTFRPIGGSPTGGRYTDETGITRAVYYHSGIAVVPPGAWLWF